MNQDTASSLPVHAARRASLGAALVLALCCIQVLFFFKGTALAGQPPLEVQAPDRVPLGQPFQVQVTSLIHFEGLEVTWQERVLTLPLQSSGDSFSASLLLGSDVKFHQPGPKQLLVSGHKHGHNMSANCTVTLAKASYPVQRLTLPEHQVDLSQEALARHRKEKRQVQQCLKSSSPQRSWSCPFARPARGDFSGRYGLKRIINGQPRSPHRGLDFRTGAAAPVKAVNAGRVALTGNHFFAGNSVYIDHGQGLVSMYFHLSSIQVSQGQTVSRGQSIGLSGSTGRVTGPHLHFGISLLGHLVDPEPVLNNEFCPQTAQGTP
jgi:hypothetical protein